MAATPRAAGIEQMSVVAGHERANESALPVKRDSSSQSRSLFTGLERGEQDMALSAIREILAILREWDTEESERDIERD